MPTVLCPMCQSSSFILRRDFNDRVQCPKCSGFYYAEIKDGLARNAKPANFNIEPPENLEEDLALDLQEACDCFNVGAYKATVVMARRFLEALLDKRGFTGRDLFHRIEAASDSGAIKKKDIHFQLASSTRILGNYGAHFSDDLLTQIGHDEAELVLKMIPLIIKGIL